MVDAEVAQRADQFVRWAKKREIFLHPDVAVAVPTRAMGCGVFARCALPAKTVIMSCPAEASFSPHIVASPYCPSLKVLLADAEVSEDGALVMTLFMMAERCRLTSSPHKPWLAVCPAMHNHLFDLTELQAALFALPKANDTTIMTVNLNIDCNGTDVKVGDEVPCTDPRRWTHVAQQLHEMNVSRRWALAQRVMGQHEELWPRKHVTFTLFCDCLAQVYSRNFHREEMAGREGPYLLPGLDLLNHSTEPDARLETRGGGRKHGLCFTVVTNQPVKRGAQLCISYGDIGVARYVVEFQFVNASVRQHDLVRFSTDCLMGLACTVRRDAALHTVSSSKQAPVKECGDVTEMADLTDRIEHLQRLGILDDEGLYLHASPESVAWAIEHTILSQDTQSTMTAIDDRKNSETAAVTELQWGDARRLWVVVYCLMIDKDRFSELYHRHLTREWNSVPAAEKATLRAWCQGFLQKRIDAAVAQDARVDDVFDSQCDGNDVEDRNAVRRGLLHDALHSELDVLRFYLHCVLPQLA